MNTPRAAAILLLMVAGIASPVRGADALYQLDPGRYGPGTIIAALEELEPRSLSAIADDTLQPRILALLGHEDPDVARTAAWLVRREGWGGAGVSTAGGVLADAAASVPQRVSAAIALGELREVGSIAALGAGLSGDSEPEVRVAAARALGELHRTAAGSPLFACLRNEGEPSVRATCAGALGSTPDVVGTELMSFLRDEDPIVRVEVAWALGRHGFREAIGNLQGALQDTDCRVGAAAAWGLAQIGDPSVVPALQAAAQSPCRLTAQASTWALSVIPH